MTESNTGKMRHQKEPQRSTWDRFWTRERSIEEVYHNDDRIPVNLGNTIDLAGKKVLEVGAGTGRDSLTIQKMGAEVYILDYVGSSLNIAREVFRKNQQPVRLILGDGTSMPFPAGSFDVVFHQGLLEHFRDPGPMLRDNIRILKPGGLLLVDVPQRYHLYTVVKHILIWMGKWFAGWETEFSIKQLQTLLEKENLTIVHQYGSWMNPSFMYRMMRESLMRIGLKLPMYPRSFLGIEKIRSRIRSRLVKHPSSFYTSICIGVIGKKSENEHSANS